jgi:hypothetical protein
LPPPCCPWACSWQPGYWAPTLRTATIWALVCSIVLLCEAGWRIGRNGGLSTLERVVSSAVAGVFGIGLILLKAFLH